MMINEFVLNYNDSDSHEDGIEMMEFRGPRQQRSPDIRYFSGCTYIVILTMST